MTTGASIVWSLVDDFVLSSVTNNHASRPPVMMTLMIVKIGGFLLRLPLRTSLVLLSFSHERASLDRLRLRRFLILFGPFVGDEISGIGRMLEEWLSGI